MSEKPTINIEIDEKPYAAEVGQMIIEVADKNDISIPRFCYHKELSIAANCRMCLVEVEKSGKPLPACATPVADGMKVYTKSHKARAAQKAVMEFLLVNHPLDCPICDQGGQCELQDVALGYGKSVSRYTERKRAVTDQNLGSLVATDMTRCIHCTRCVRFGEEVAGLRELGMVARGEQSKISTYVQHSMASEVSGNIIDLCPVGALTSKPFRYRARAWELEQSPSIASHDCLGSNILVHHTRQAVKRVVPGPNDAINQCWLSDRDRFSYEAINSIERLVEPRINDHGRWRMVDWQTALNSAAKAIEDAITHYGFDEVAGIISPSATCEEQFLFQQLLRAKGIQNIDHRIRQVDFRDDSEVAAYPKSSCSLADLSSQRAYLFVGSHIRHEQPLAALRVRKAVLNGAAAFAINPIDYDFNFNLQAKQVCAPQAMVQALAAVLKAAVEQTNATKHSEFNTLLQAVNVTPEATAMAQSLIAADNSVIILGALAEQHPDRALLQSLAQMIADVTATKLMTMTTGANGAGAWLTGCVPHRGPAGRRLTKSGQTAEQLFRERKKVYILFGIEPELDCAEPKVAMDALQAAEKVIMLTPYTSDAMLQYADILLPITPFAETSGTFINIDGHWQSFQGIVAPQGEARPGWKVLRVLGNFCNCDGFDYTSSEAVRAELHTLVENTALSFETKPFMPDSLPSNDIKCQRVGYWPIYRIDSMVRRSEPLQQTPTQPPLAVAMNQQQAELLGVADAKLVEISQGDGSSRLPLVIDERIPAGCVAVPAGYNRTALLNGLFAEIEVRKAT